MNDLTRAITIDEVMQRLSVSRPTVYALIHSGELAHFRIGLKGEGNIRVRLSSLEKFMEAREERCMGIPAATNQATPRNVA